MEWRALRLGFSACPLCGFRVLARFGDSEHAIRCLRCGAGPATLSLVDVLQRHGPDIARCAVYELSSRGPLFGYLEKHAGRLVFSEYFDEVPPGESKDGVLCQDVQHLTFADGSFDLCTSTDVFEHVPHDARAFRELHRVLRPGGMAVFTVPIRNGGRTVERAALDGDRLEHFLPAEYHDDHIRGTGRVFCYRNYGRDIVDRLRAAGFDDARIVDPDASRWWGYGRPVVLAQRV